MDVSMQWFQNEQAYVAMDKSEGHKMFLKLTPVANVIKLFPAQFTMLSAYCLEF
jgi:hypothetical protein